MSALRAIRHYRLFSTSTSTTPLSISSAKSKLRSEHDPDKALQLYNNVITNPNTSPVASHHAEKLTIRRLARSRRFSDIENLIESHKQDPNITQENFYSTLIRSYGIAGMPQHAAKTYEQMEEVGTPRTSLSFNALLSANIACKKFDLVEKVFDEMPNKYGFVPDQFSYGILIKSYCELGLPEKGLGVLDQMRGKGVEVTTICYTTVLDALYKKRKIVEAEKLWKDMVKKGCELDVAAYNVRVMHPYEGKPEEVLSVIGEMESKGLKPDTISYNYLFTCYCKNGMLEEAEKVVEDLEVNGCFPNAATFRLYVFHMCRNGEYEKALKMYKESVKRDKVPSFGIMKMLVERLVKIGRRKDAKRVVKTVKKKFPANSLSAWNKLEVELGLNKDEPSLEGEADVASA